MKSDIIDVIGRISKLPVEFHLYHTREVLRNSFLPTLLVDNALKSFALSFLLNVSDKIEFFVTELVDED